MKWTLNTCGIDVTADTGSSGCEPEVATGGMPYMTQIFYKSLCHF